MLRFVELPGRVDVLQTKAFRVQRPEGLALEIARMNGGGEVSRRELPSSQAMLEWRQARRSIDRAHRDEPAGSIFRNDSIVLR